MPPASPNPSSTTKQQQKWLTPPPYRKNKSSSKENANPNSDLNSSPAVTGVLKMKSPLPPRHPNSNPLKRKLSVESENGATVAAGSSDSGVKVISSKFIVLTLLKM